MNGLHKWFNVLARDILRRVPSADPNAEKTKLICQKIISLTNKQAADAIFYSYLQVFSVFASMALIFSGYYVYTHGIFHDKVMLVTFVISIVTVTQYLFFNNNDSSLKKASNK